MSTARTFRDQISDHLPALRSYARSLLRNRDQADDLEQDCIERALSKAHLYADDTNLRAWLFTIMRNIFITQARRETVRLRSSWHVGALSHDTIPARQDVLLELKESIQLTKILSTFERRVVEQMCLNDLGYDETARRTRQPIGTIKSRLSRARQRLREAARIADIDVATPASPVHRLAAAHGGADMRRAA